MKQKERQRYLFRLLSISCLLIGLLSALLRPFGGGWKAYAGYIEAEPEAVVIGREEVEENPQEQSRQETDGAGAQAQPKQDDSGGAAQRQPQKEDVGAGAQAQSQQETVGKAESGRTSKQTSDTISEAQTGTSYPQNAERQQQNRGSTAVHGAGSGTGTEQQDAADSSPAVSQNSSIRRIVTEGIASHQVQSGQVSQNNPSYSDKSQSNHQNNQNQYNQNNQNQNNQNQNNHQKYSRKQSSETKNGESTPAMEKADAFAASQKRETVDEAETAGVTEIAEKTESSHTQSNTKSMQISRAEGEYRLWIAGLFVIYSTTVLLWFLICRVKGGKEKMKMLWKKMVGLFLLMLFMAVESPHSAYAAEQTDLFAFDWRQASDEEINHMLGITDYEEIGYWLRAMPEEELSELLTRDTVLPKQTSFVTYGIGENGEWTEEKTEENTYYEYCMSQATGLVKAQKFLHASGYFDYRFVMKTGGADKVSRYRMKISGLDTEKTTKEQQTVTVNITAVEETNGNFAGFSAKAGNYNAVSGYNTKKLDNELDGSGNYYNLLSGFGFTKPAGYTAAFQRENYKAGKAVVYYYDNNNFKTSKKEFTGDTNSAEAVWESLVSYTNIINNTTVGGSSEGEGKAVCYTFTFYPVTYTVQYNGNGATSGSVAQQSCTYGQSYYTQQNGYAKQFPVTYNGNGGTSDKAGDTASYVFKGWGLENAASVTHAASQAYSNVKNTQGAIGTFYAIWNPAGVVLPSAQRAGYTFKGWNADSRASSGMGEGTAFTPAAGTTLYATWEANKYTIEYYDGMTGRKRGSQSMTYGVSAPLKKAEELEIARAGYQFRGWAGNGGTYQDGQSVSDLTTKNGGTVALSAVWEACTETPYEVRHLLETTQGSGQYVLRETERLTATTGASVTPATKVYENYAAPSMTTVTVAGDGSTVVSYYYKWQGSAEDSGTANHTTNIDHANGTINTDNTSGASNANNTNHAGSTDNTNDTSGADDRNSRSSASLNEGNRAEEDLNHFKAGDTRYIVDASGNKYEIYVNPDGTLTIRSMSAAASGKGNVKIAGTLSINNTKYKVTEIAPYAFQNNKKIKTVTIGNGITAIGKSAFEGCTKLRSVKLGTGVSVIGTRAFYGCTALETVRTPKTLTRIEAKAFYNCKKLKSFTIGKYVRSIGSKAFYNCRKLKKITVSESVELIEKQAFYQCSSLKSVRIRSTRLVKIGSGAFKKCNRSLKFTVPAKKKKAYMRLLKGKA
ncbi:MAG: leucine-rich repeat protein [Lachnospiraceae bacterium]|nr:leucine-rich repeat protein [Lachnospiraceae bacterium]